MSEKCNKPSVLSTYLFFCQSCALLLSLSPFFLSSALYFYLWTPDSAPSVVFAGVKSAPTLLLAAVVLSWKGTQSVLGVAGGLIFSAVGDCCLVWPELFIHGNSLSSTEKSRSKWSQMHWVKSKLAEQFLL